MKKIPFNPYIVGNPVKTKEMFFGRQDEFQYVIKKIGEIHTNQIIVFCGDRRSGKTSILFQILSGRLGGEFVPVLIDMQILAGIRSDFDLYKAILGTACATLKHPKIILEEITAGSENNIALMFETFLKLFQQHYPGKEFLLLLDEYELIEAKIKDGTLSEAFIHHLAGILESPYKISFIFTGSTNLEKRRTEYWKSLLGKSIYKKISYLSFDDTARLITEPLKDYIHYTPELAAAIYRLSGGQPFYTQVICQNMVDFLTDEAKNEPEAADLEKITRDIIDNPLPQMIYSWKSLSNMNKLVLSALAGVSDNDNAWNNAGRIYTFFKKSKIQLPLSIEQVKIALEEDYHNEFLEKNDQDAYRFKIDLLRRWIKKEHSIWKVIKETGTELKKRWNPLILAGITAVSLVTIILGILFINRGPTFPAASPGSGTQPVNTNAVPETANFQIISNHAPFAVIIDNNPKITSEGQDDPYKITIPSLKTGEHQFIFTSARTGEQKKSVLTINGTRSYQVNFQESAHTVTITKKMSPQKTMSGMDASPGIATATAITDGLHIGSIYIITDPPGAEILLDGRLLDDKTGFHIKQLTPGTYALEIRKAGYRTEAFTADIEAGQMITKELALKPVYGKLYLNIRPAGKIYIDGKYYTEAPYVKPFELQAGEHIIRIVNEDLDLEKQRSVTIEYEGEERRIDIDLQEGD